MKKVFKSIISTVLTLALLSTTLLTGAVAADSDFTYTVDAFSGTATIIGYTGSSVNIVIPESLGGEPVAAIGENAFYFRPAIESVSIPSTVTSIGAGAFWGCTNLSNVLLSEGLKSIGDTAFFNTAITNLVIPDTVTSIGERTFAQCKSLTSAVLSESLEEITESAFYDCESLESITIPDSVSAIRREAFALCDSLASVKIGRGVVTVETNAFHDCPCSGLTIPITVKQIDSEAFGYNTDRSSYDTGLMPDFVISGVSGTAAQQYALDNSIRFIACSHSSVTGGDYIEVPTCTTGGSQYQMCADCYTVMGTVTLSALGHNYVLKTVPPTCTDYGYDIYTCTRCGASYIDDDSYTPPIGTEHVLGEPVVVAPTCTQEGYTISTCIVCGYEERYNYEFALGHDLVEVGVILPTCTQSGYTVYHCNRCGQDFNMDPIPALGHDFDPQQTRIVPPTCTDSGYTVYHCSRCGQDFEMDIVPARGHDYVGSIVEPTCTENGYTRYVCSVCGDEYIDDYTDALGHDFVLSKVKEATYSSKGSAYVLCSRCSFSMEDPAYATDYKTLSKPKGLKASSQTTSSVKLKWSAVTGAVKYTVYNVTAKKTVSVTGASYTFTGLKPGTVYKFEVRAVAGANKGAYCTPIITATKPIKATLSSVTAKGSGKVLIKWKKISASSGYQIQYSTSKSFNSGNKSVTVGSMSTVSKTVKSLKKGKVYYVRVRAFKYGYGQKHYGAWSSVKTVKVR